MKTDFQPGKKPFELRVMAVKAGRFAADTTGRGMNSGDTSQPEFSTNESVRVGSGQALSNESAESSRTNLEAKGDRPIRASRSVQSRWSGISRRGQTIVRKLLLAASGQFGAAAASAVSLSLTLRLADYSGRWVYEALAALLLIRLVYHLTRGPIPVLGKYHIRRRFWWVLADEIQISVAFVAACFLMTWPTGLRDVAIFTLMNLVAQFGLLYYSRTVIKALAGDLQPSDNTTFAKRAVIFGTGPHAQRVADMVLASPELDTKLTGFLDYHRTGMWRYRDIPLIGKPDRLEEIITNGQVDAVFVAVEPEDIPRSRSLFNTAEQMGVCVFVMPNVYYPTVSKIRPTYINGMPALVYRSAPENRVALFAKAVIDRVGALIGLALSAPIMLATSLLIKLESKGPVLFKQVRAGENGKNFHLYKFRTMCIDAEDKKAALSTRNEMSGPVFKIREDPRVTTIGRLLRKFSIDELPQFVNVLKGEMSLVGPRPPLPSEVSGYQPWQHRKLSVKPGVTCLWQINGRNQVDFDEWMRLDLEYIDNWSLALDTKILLKTLPAVLKGTGV
jgi:exopolysaccharide biosynthesis polyprenyl glycosylphosphotransferase